MKEEVVEGELIETLPEIKPTDKCNGRNKLHTKYCGKPAGWGTDHVGDGRCTLHGGSSLKGPEHPNYLTGKHSKYSKIPGYLAPAFERLLEDDNYLDSKEDIILLIAMINDELAGLSNHKQSNYWFKELEDAYSELLLTSVEGKDKLKASIENLGKVIYEGQSKRETRKEITEMQKVLDNLRATNVRIKKDIHGMISGEQFDFFIKRTLSILKEEIKDPHTMKRIVVEVRKLIPSKGNKDEGQN